MAAAGGDVVAVADRGRSEQEGHDCSGLHLLLVRKALLPVLFHGGALELLDTAAKHDRDASGGAGRAPSRGSEYAAIQGSWRRRGCCGQVGSGISIMLRRLHASAEM